MRFLGIRTKQGVLFPSPQQQPAPSGDVLEEPDFETQPMPSSAPVESGSNTPNADALDRVEELSSKPRPISGASDTISKDPGPQPSA